jgi:hypothetical protein
MCQGITEMTDDRVSFVPEFSRLLTDHPRPGNPQTHLSW